MCFLTLVLIPSAIQEKSNCIFIYVDFDIFHFDFLILYILLHVSSCFSHVFGNKLANISLQVHEIQESR